VKDLWHLILGIVSYSKVALHTDRVGSSSR
jgi:hypothetical protein